MINLSGKPGSGAQTLAAPRAARGEDLAAAGRGQSGAEAMTALAHQLAGLVSPLHGSFSADILSAKLTICLINEICPLMLAGRKQAIFRPKSSRPGRTGFIADNCAAYTGATRFRQCCRVAAARFFETAQLARIIQYSRCFTCEDAVFYLRG
jgi:hypothetical protein